MDKDEPELHLEACVWWITNNNRVYRDQHVVVYCYLVSEALPSSESSWQRGRKRVVLMW